MYTCQQPNVVPTSERSWTTHLFSAVLRFQKWNALSLYYACSETQRAPIYLQTYCDARPRRGINAKYGRGRRGLNLFSSRDQRPLSPLASRCRGKYDFECCVRRFIWISNNIGMYREKENKGFLANGEFAGLINFINNSNRLWVTAC